MIDKDFKKRLITSLFLFILVSVCVFLNKYLWLMFVFFISLISYTEFDNLLLQIKQIQKKYLFMLRFVVIIYLLSLCFISFIIYEEYLIFILLICVLSDTGGYIFGKTFGGKKLTRISPNKTVAGAIGSVFFSLLPFIFVKLTKKDEFTLFNIFNENNYVFLFTVCIFLSIVCQIGDLVISYFKRKAKVKDTGNILPGHGGLLDRIDGVIFVIPISYLIFNIL